MSGQFFLSIRTGLRSLCTSYCQLDLSFHRINLIWVWPSIQTCFLSCLGAKQVAMVCNASETGFAA